MPAHTSSIPRLLEDDSKQLAKDIVVISPKDLEPGILGKLFHNGMKVVILKDPRILQIWDGFLDPHNSEGTHTVNPRMPWEENLFTVASNHVPHDNNLGDMFRFTPRMIAHIARKIKIFPISNGRSIQAVPNYFFQGDRKFSYPNSLLEIAWEIMSNLINSVMPNDSAPLLYAVNIEFLKYPDPNELKKVFTLLSDTSGEWTKIGQKVDAYKGMASGIFNKKILRDIFGLSLLIPGMMSLLGKLNTHPGESIEGLTATRQFIIGSEHVDGSKFFTALASDRDILKTQVYTSEGWVDLPLTPDSLAIFPSQKSTKAFGFSPTWHRILLEKTNSCYAEPKKNVTLTLSIVER